MEINVSTVYGDIRLVFCYDVSAGNYYDAYDEANNYLGELWDMPLYDEEDKEESDKAYQIAVETAIDNNEISIPCGQSKNVTDVYVTDVYIVTVCQTCGNGKPIAYSKVFSLLDKAKDYKMDLVTKFLDVNHSLGIQTDVADADEFCEITTTDRTHYMCITIKCTQIE